MLLVLGNIWLSALQRAKYVSSQPCPKSPLIEEGKSFLSTCSLPSVSVVSDNGSAHDLLH